MTSSCFSTMLRYVLLLCLVCFISAAPLNKDPKAEVNRAKRDTEKVIHGNHQNAERVKKSGPPAPPAVPAVVEKSAYGTDGKSTVKIETLPVEVVEGVPVKDTSAGMKTADDIDVQPETKVIVPKPEARGSPQEVPVSSSSSKEAYDEKEEDGDTSLERLFQSNEDEEILDALKDLKSGGESWQSEEVDDDSSGDEEENSKETSPQEPKESQEDTNYSLDDLYNYFDPDNGYPKEYDYFYSPYQNYRQKRSTDRKKRAVKDTDMGETADGGKRRVKRDIRFSDDDYNSLQDMLRRQEEEEEEEAEADPRPYYGDHFSGGQGRRGWTREQLEDMLGGNYGAAFRPEQPVSDDEIAEFLRFLYGDDSSQDVGAPIQPQYGYGDDLMNMATTPEEQPEYKPIVYNGEPGVFVPVKRQMLSLLPGIRKRSFYPYAYQPQTKWGAFLPGVKRAEEDLEEEYDRLYKLASYLKRRNDYLQLPYKKK